VPQDRAQVREELFLHALRYSTMFPISLCYLSFFLGPRIPQLIAVFYPRLWGLLFPFISGVWMISTLDKRVLSLFYIHVRQPSAIGILAYLPKLYPHCTTFGRWLQFHLSLPPDSSLVVFLTNASGDASRIEKRKTFPYSYCPSSILS
jgi:hypothetical protein